MSFSINVVMTSAFSQSQKAIIDVPVARCKKMVVNAPSGVTGVLIEVRTSALALGQNAESKITMSWPVGLPKRAELILSATKLAALENDGRLADIVLHELLHCLGFGLSWNKLGKLIEIGGAHVFVGKGATAEYGTLLTAAGKDSIVAGVPVEAGDVAGQSGIHWRDSVFGDELMSTAQPKAGNPLSRMSLASLEDLGYDVELKHADPYQL